MIQEIGSPQETPLEEAWKVINETSHPSSALLIRVCLKSTLTSQPSSDITLSGLLVLRGSVRRLRRRSNP